MYQQLKGWGKIFMPHQRRSFPSRLLVWMKGHCQRCGWPYLVAMCGVLDMALLGAWGLAPTIELALAPSAIQPETGQAYYTVLGPLGLRFPYGVASDGTTHPMASQLQLLENGRPLGPGHALHQTIRDVGQGTFSHWIGHLYFSTSDGTDPRTNGRHYTIRVTAEVVPWVLWGLATGNAVALGFGANWLRRRLGAARWAWFRRGIVAILQLILLVLLTGGMILQFGVWTQTQSLPEPFVHYDGHAYTFGFRADIAWPWVFYTPTSDPTGIRSQLDFFENDHALTRQNTAEAIIAQGNGVYSHWGDQLYFASSDNSNPNTNGFSYRVEYPVLMRGCILFGLFVILIFLIWW